MLLGDEEELIRREAENVNLLRHQTPTDDVVTKLTAHFLYKLYLVYYTDGDMY